jgi:hypothetical protein
MVSNGIAIEEKTTTGGREKSYLKIVDIDAARVCE